VPYSRHTGIRNSCPGGSGQAAGDVAEGGAEDGAGERVQGVVHAGVDAGVGDGAGQGVERQRGRGQDAPGAACEGEGGGGVAGGERLRGGHRHVAGDRHLVEEAVGTAAAGERLHRDVDDGGGDG